MVADAGIKGWCPGALRPMTSGDGLVVRIRPRLARLSRDQVLSLCHVAQAFGSGQLDLTNRANIQIRGVSQADWQPLIRELTDAGLVDASEAEENRRNILVAPDWRPGDDTHQITSLLLDQLDQLPELPSKVGFAIDAGHAPILSGDSADFRIERSHDGELLLRADGHGGGTPLSSPEAAVNALIDIAHWFAQTGGRLAGRMRRHAEPLPDWAETTSLPARPCSIPPLGTHPMGSLYGLVFGQVEAAELANAMTTSQARAMRLTPWRRLLLEGATIASHSGLLTDNNAPELSADACVGAPFCEQASVATRQLARRLSPAVAGHLHVSGCPKGCACQSAAAVCVTGQAGHYNLIFDGRADDEPDVTGLTESQVLSYFGVT